MNTHESYVSLETAKMLKEAGFDWECVKNYMGEISLLWTATTPGNLNDDSGVHKGWKSAPTLDVAQRWLREVKGCYTFVKPIFSANRKLLYYLSDVVYDKDYNTVFADTYEEAQEAGIKKAVELILKKGE